MNRHYEEYCRKVCKYCGDNIPIAHGILRIGAPNCHVIGWNGKSRQYEEDIYKTCQAKSLDEWIDELYSYALAGGYYDKK